MKTSMKATLTFTTRENAEAFARAWGRSTKTGHVIGAGMENVKVTIYDVTDENKKFIDEYIKTLES